MQAGNLVLLLVALGAVFYFFGWRRSYAVSAPLGGVRHLHSLPGYYASLAAIWCVLPALALLGLWIMIDDTVILTNLMASLPASIQPQSDIDHDLLLNQIRNIAGGALNPASVPAEVAAAAERLNAMQATNQLMLNIAFVSISILGGIWGWSRVQPRLRARQKVESVMKWLLMASATVAILTTLGIVLSVLFESIRFFQKVSPMEFLFGLQWSPQIALRPDQVGATGAFGAVPLFAGTLLISLDKTEAKHG